MGTRPLLGPAIRLARELGFTPEWFSDSVAFCGERGDAGLFLHGHRTQVCDCASGQPTSWR